MNARLMWAIMAFSLPFFCSMAQSKKQKGKVEREVVQDTIPVIEIPQDRIDTIYYDNNWRAIKNKAFASYFRYALYPADSLAARKSRTFYITGELEGEGDFIELSPSNDKQSKFTGLYTHYYKSTKPSRSYNYRDGVLEGEYIIYNESGKPSEAGAYKQGVLNGKQITYYDNGKPSKVCHYQEGAITGLYITYYESGLIHEYVNMRDGKREGIESIFSENGEICTQSLYSDGNRSTQYILTDKRGNCTLYNSADNSPVFVAPSPEEMKTEYKNGVAWPYYNKNGLIIGVSQVEDNEVGSYKELQFFLSNNSMSNVDIDPSTIVAYTMKKGERKVFEFMDSEDYYKKIYKKKKKAAKAVIKKKAVVEMEKQSNLNSNLGATMFDETMNTLNDFQQRMIQKKDLTENKHVMADNEPEDIEYLQRTTVHPGEAVSGYLLIDDKKMDFLYVDMTINGILYPYKWDLRKKK